HKLQPRFIQYASFNGIQDLNEVHKPDLTSLSYNKIGNQIFKHRGVIKDVATRFHKSCALTNKSFVSLVKMFKAIYEDSNNYLIWPKVLIVNKGIEYLAVKKALKDSVLYLLEFRELEFGKRHITDMNWSSKVYHIKELLIQKNQLVLYWLIDENRNGPEKTFVREQLIKVGKVVYPPK
ncbi:9744_t:CDS:2, partial [Cetraspora pellucida]